MINVKEELEEHIGDKDVEFVRIVFSHSYYGQPPKVIEGSPSDVLPQLNFEYDDGYGGQQLFGYVWYKDGTWSQRGEYDGSEWWEHVTRPTLDVNINA